MRFVFINLKLKFLRRQKVFVNVGPNWMRLRKCISCRRSDPLHQLGKLWRSSIDNKTKCAVSVPGAVKRLQQTTALWWLLFNSKLIGRYIEPFVAKDVVTTLKVGVKLHFFMVQPFSCLILPFTQHSKGSSQQMNCPDKN